MQRKLRVATWAAIAALACLIGGVVAYEAVQRGKDGVPMSGTSIGAPFSLVDRDGQFRARSLSARTPMRPSPS